MDVVTIVSATSQIANSQVVWSILCIGLAVYVLKHSSKLEERLLNNLDKLTAAQTEQAKTMEKISENLETVEQRMDRMEKHIYSDKKKESA
ncbi:MAG: BhlA/UviB family holin-like peptide [Solibacillus sp.]